MKFNSIIEAQRWFAKNWQSVWGELSAIGFYHWALINHPYLYPYLDIQEELKIFESK